MQNFIALFAIFPKKDKIKLKIDLKACFFLCIRINNQMT